MKDNERDQLHKLVDALEANLRDAARDIARLEGDLAAVAADRDALRAKLRMVVDRGRPVHLAEEEGGELGVSVVLERREWDGVVGALGDTKEQP